MKHMETDILSFKLILTNLGVEAEMSSIPPEKLKQVMMDNEWWDAELMAVYEQAWVATNTLYRKLNGYDQ